MFFVFLTVQNEYVMLSPLTNGKWHIIYVEHHTLAEYLNSFI